MLATRACAATLRWEKQELLVATGAAELDLDAFGVDLGDGVPVATFQIKKSEGDCCTEYAIYSLAKPPRLLRTVRGGEFFGASDMDLDGKVEIWTNDAAAMEGFEKLSLGELDSVPTVVFRFAHGQLLDVSTEFQPYFDAEIARLRTAQDPQDLADFKNSDGQFSEPPTPATAERLHHLRITKIKVLEIVWAALYSGREQDAWRDLAEMWPPADIDRIRAALLKTRALGIHSQADGTSAGRAPGKKKQTPIFDMDSKTIVGDRLDITPPIGILLELPPGSEIFVSGNRHPDSAQSEGILVLIIDAAGKVISAEPAGRMGGVGLEQIKSALTWKFIPAFKNGEPVASRIRIAVSPKS